MARLTAELGYPAETAEIAQRFSELDGREDHYIIVAEKGDNHLLGTVMAERRSLLVCGPRVEIMGLVVSAEARRKGIAKALARAVEEWARQLGVERVVVRSNLLRPESHPFYEGIGYRRDKTQHVYSKSLGKQKFV